jgi:hypothetical protein
MPSRRFLGVAIVFGALGIVWSGQAAQAQTPSSVRFVSLLLANESKLILSDMNAFNKRDAEIVNLNNATSQRQINQLNRLLTKLNNQILVMTLQLQVLSTQSLTYARELTPANPSLVSQAVSSVLAVQVLSQHAGLGLVPSTAIH